jgi:hypothetical protein
MSARQLRLLVVALAGLLVLWGASRLFSHGSDVLTGTLSFPGITSGTADSIVMTHEADTARLGRSGERWSVNGHPASLQAVQDLFLALRDTSAPDVAALSATSFERMGVDSAAAWHLAISSGGHAVLRLFVGKSGPGSGTGYLRQPGSDTVYLWRGRLPALVRRPIDQWRDHRIVGVPPDSVRGIEVQRDRQHYALEGQGGRWHFAGSGAGGAPADSAKVVGLLGRYANLQATGFASDAQADSTRGRRPQRSVTLRGAGDTVLAQISFDSTATGYWVRREGDPTVYRLDTWQVNGITPADTTLRATSQAKPPAKAPAKPPAHH